MSGGKYHFGSPLFWLANQRFLENSRIMSQEAHITAIWKKQKGFLALFLAAIGLWFLFDARTGFPRSNERWIAHEKLSADNRLSEWPELAKEKGWNETPPHKFYQREDLLGQYVAASVLFLGATAAFLYWLSQIKRVFKLDDEAVILPNGKRVPFAAVTRINRKKWDAKGLATVYFSIDGRPGKFLLDDYKFDRNPMHAIMAAIEENRTSN